MMEGMLDPETIILGGVMTEPLLRWIADRLPPLAVSVADHADRPLPRLIVGAAGPDTPALGAAALPIFDESHPQLNLLLKRAHEPGQPAARAEMLWRIRREERRIDHLPPELRPAALAEGYDIQDAMVAIAGQPVWGWRSPRPALPGKNISASPNPSPAACSATSSSPTGAHRPAKNMHMRVFEAEFAFKMARTLPARGP